jgi:GNAT superfamily N-acetyltransferase
VPEFSISPVPAAVTRELRQAVLRPNLTVAELESHEPAGAVAIGAFDADRLVSVGLIGEEGGEGSWRVRGMATVPAARGRGAGSAVLGALVEHALSRGATRVWCNARVPARSLYERAGFHVASAEFDVDDIGPHYVMELIPAGSR